MQYKSIWWEACNEMAGEEELETLMDRQENRGWNIYKMFLVYTEEKESYRIILFKE